MTDIAAAWVKVDDWATRTTGSVLGQWVLPFMKLFPVLRKMTRRPLNSSVKHP